MAKVSVVFYTDSICTLQLVTGAPTQYTSSGIDMTVASNVTTPIYARTYNEVGTASDCNSLINFRHADLGPASPSIAQNSNGSLRVSWSPDLIANPTPKYIVKRSLNASGPYAIVGSDVASALFTDNMVNHNQIYYYRVQATNSTGSSQDSVEVSRTVNSPAPTQPFTLTASPGPTEVRLAWSGFVQNMTYKIERRVQSGGSFSRLPVNVSGITYIDTSVTDGVIYVYRVIGVNPQGESAVSNEAIVAPLSVPSAVANIWISPTLESAACAGGPGVHIYWSPAPYAHGYEVWRLQRVQMF